jgi:putative oxidoreductase
MATAIRTVHGPKGPWVTDGGYEYNLVLMAIVFAITDVGPGAWSVDAASGHERWGARWALAQLAAGVAGSAGALVYARSRPEPQAADAETAPEPEPVAST